MNFTNTDKNWQNSFRVETAVGYLRNKFATRLLLSTNDHWCQILKHLCLSKLQLNDFLQKSSKLCHLCKKLI